ncbi:MAG: hypothetical protein AAGJ35_15700, partial [Myxococcota bacterium]
TQAKFKINAKSEAQSKTKEPSATTPKSEPSTRRAANVQTTPSREGTAATITLTIRTGPPCRFGKIIFRRPPLVLGTQKIPARVPNTLLRNYISFKKNQPYRRTALFQSQRTLSNLGVFGTVNFKPQIQKIKEQQRHVRNQQQKQEQVQTQIQQKLQKLQQQTKELQEQTQSWKQFIAQQRQPLIRDKRTLRELKARAQKVRKEREMLQREQKSTQQQLEQLRKRLQQKVHIPVVLELREDRFQKIKLGGGFAIDGQRNIFELSLRWTILHFFGGLRKLTFQLQPGWAFLPDVFRRVDSGPDFTGSLTLSQPFFLKEKGEIQFRALGRFSQEIGDTDFWRFNPSLSVT